MTGWREPREVRLRRRIDELAARVDKLEAQRESLSTRLRRAHEHAYRQRRRAELWRHRALKRAAA